MNIGHTAAGKDKQMQDAEEEGTMHFMVHVIQPQFNLHSEEGHVSLSVSVSDFFPNFPSSAGTLSG